jgi:hypothetical protein
MQKQNQAEAKTKSGGRIRASSQYARDLPSKERLVMPTRMFFF